MNTVLCLLCERDGIEVEQLSGHVAGDLDYAPYSCGECSFSSPDKNAVVVHTFQEKHFSRKINVCHRPYMELLIDRIVNDCLVAANDGLQVLLGNDFSNSVAMETVGSSSSVGGDSTSFAGVADKGNVGWHFKEMSQMTQPRPVVLSNSSSSCSSAPALQQPKIEIFFDDELEEPSVVTPANPNPNMNSSFGSFAQNQQQHNNEVDERPDVYPLLFKPSNEKSTGKTSASRLRILQKALTSYGNSTVADMPVKRPRGRPVGWRKDRSAMSSTSTTSKTTTNNCVAKTSSAPKYAKKRCRKPLRHGAYRKVGQTKVPKTIVGTKSLCRRCGRYFPSLVRQWMHVAYHANNLMSCPYCDFRVKTGISMVSHVRNAHPLENFSIFHVKERDALLNDVESYFPQSVKSIQQIIAGGGDADVEPAISVSASFSLESDNQDQDEDSDDQDGSDDDIGYSSVPLSKLKATVKTKMAKRMKSSGNGKLVLHPNEYWRKVPCHVCDMQIRNSYFEKRAHIKNYHSVENEGTRRYFNSPVFHSTYAKCFGSTQARHQSGAFNRLNMTCNFCGEIATTLVARETHALVKHLGHQFVCPFCNDFQTTWTRKFKNHIRMFHNDEPTDYWLSMISQMKAMVLKCFKQSNKKSKVDVEMLSQDESDYPFNIADVAMVTGPGEKSSKRLQDDDDVDSDFENSE